MSHSGRRTIMVLGAVTVLSLAGCNGEEDDAEPADEGAADDEQVEEGRVLFADGAQPACVSCHALSDADSTGGIGPDLDRLAPSAEQVTQALRSGPGQMPSYADDLSDEEMDALAAYVEATADSG